MPLGGTVQSTQERSTPHPRPPGRRINPDLSQPGQVDHQTAIGHRVACGAVPATANADLEVPVTGHPDGRDDVLHAAGPHDHPRVPIDSGVPDHPGCVVPLVPRVQHIPTDVAQ